MSVDLSKLDEAFKSIEKDVGKGVVVDLDDYSNIPRIKSDSPLLNYITNGGFPRGKIVEIYGPESSGKSLVAQQAGVKFQQAGEFVAYIDTEFSFNRDFAEKLGLDTTPEKFKLFQPSTLEGAFEIAEILSEAGVGLIIFDSVASMTPEAEVEAGYGDKQMGEQARGLGKGIRKIASILNKKDTLAIFINQIRQSMNPYGPSEVTPGGKALRFYASLRLKTRRKDFLVKGKGEPYGVLSEVEGYKSKIGPPKRKGMLTILFDSGIDSAGEYVDFAVKYGVIEKAGSWLTLPNQERVQGKEKVREYLLENLDVFEVVKEKVNKILLPTNEEGVVEEEDSEEEPLEVETNEE